MVDLSNLQTEKLQVTKDKLDGTVTVNIELSPKGETEEVRITTKEVQRYVKSLGHDVKECTKGDVVTNSGDRLAGSWKFRTLEPITLPVENVDVVPAPTEKKKTSSKNKSEKNS